ncbi:MAG: PAS domain-containing protein [Rhodospirillaceae bacterium]
MEDWIRPDDLASGRLISLRDYWRARRGTRPWPLRSDIDPVDIPALLPGVMLIDVETEPQRFRFRLVGTRMVEVFGQDPTGKYLDQPWHRRETASLLAPLRRTVASAGPAAVCGIVAWDNGASVDIEWLFLPLGNASGRVSMILAGADFFSQRLQYPEGEPRIELCRGPPRPGPGGGRRPGIAGG